MAGEKVHTVADLAGKVVAFAGAGTSQEDAARQAFATLNIKVKDTPLDLANALDGLSTGDIEAVVVLAPQPITQLAVLGTPGLHLISWPEGGSVPDDAVVTSIDGVDDVPLPQEIAAPPAGLSQPASSSQPTSFLPPKPSGPWASTPS